MGMIFDPPEVAKKNIPEWYKNQSTYTTEKRQISSNGNPNHTIKSCMPIFDMMTAGYYITLPAEVSFDLNEDGSHSIHWSTDRLSLVETHTIDQYSSLPVPSGYSKHAFKFVQPWITKTPPGYSCIFLPPTHRYNDPLLIFPAIVDTDKHEVAINFPFFIREGFSGTLPIGTPIAQVIPFKREPWKMEIGFDTDNNQEIQWQRAKRKIGNRYKTFWRSIKEWD